RFSTKYDKDAAPNDKKELNTQVYVGDNEDPEDCKTVTQIEKHFMWKCKAQFALKLSKVWIMKTDEKKCSIAISCLQIGVTEQPKTSNSYVTKQISGRLFGKKSVPKDSVEESVDDEESTKTVNKTLGKVAAK